MSGIKSNIRYWTWCLGNIMLLFLLFTCVYQLVRGLLGGEDFQNILSFAGMYLPIFLAMISSVIGFIIGDSYIPLALSMGSTRKDLFLGMELVFHIIFGIVVLLAWVINCIASENVPAAFAMQSLPFLTLMFLSAGCGNFVLAAIPKGRGFAVFIMVLTILAELAFATLILVIPYLQGMWDSMVDMWREIILNLILLLAALLIDALSLWLVNKSLKHREVRV